MTAPQPQETVKRTLRDIDEQLNQPLKTPFTEQLLALIAEVEEMRHEYATGIREGPDALLTLCPKQIDIILKDAKRNQ